MILSLLVACGPNALELTDTANPWQACEAPAAPVAGALERIGEVKYEAEGEAWEDVIVNLVDVEVDWERDRIVGAGQGGVVVAQGLAGEPETLAMFTDGEISRFHTVTLMGDDLVVATNRDAGLWILRILDDDSLEPVHIRRGMGFSGTAVQGHWLYVAGHDGQVTVLDVREPSAPVAYPGVSGLGNAWRVVLDGDRAYVADNVLGVVVLDLTDPAWPEWIATVPLAGGVQDLVLDGDHLYAAIGAAGLEVLSLQDRDLPESVAVVDQGGVVVSVAADDDLLWAADHDGVRVLDVSSPDAPVPLGSMATDEWALHVDADGDRAVVADWGDFDLFQVDRDRRVAEVSLSPDELIFYDDASTLSLSLTNRGGGPLSLDGLCAEDPRLTARADRSELAPGETATIQVTLEDREAAFDGVLGLATSDPRRPVVEVPVSTSSTRPSAIAVGEDAIDFVLQDLDGNSRRLSEQKDKPVFLMFFATW